MKEANVVTDVVDCIEWLKGPIISLIIKWLIGLIDASWVT
jgi:hypothetical protein